MIFLSEWVLVVPSCLPFVCGEHSLLIVCSTTEISFSTTKSKLSWISPITIFKESPKQEERGRGARASVLELCPALHVSPANPEYVTHAALVSPGEELVFKCRLNKMR